MYMGKAFCEQCLLCVAHKTSFSSALGMQVGLLQWGPVFTPPTFEQTLFIVADMWSGLDLGFFLMLFLCGISPTCPWRPSDCQNLCLPTTHVVPAASALWPAVPRVPVWLGDGLRDWTWLLPGVTFGLRNNGCCLPPSTLLPDPLSQSFWSLFLVTYQMCYGRAWGRGKGACLR